MNNSEEEGEEEEEEGEVREEEEEEEFFESLDRIISSSSCSSASSSDDDDGGRRNHPVQRRHNQHHGPRFPASWMYDVWISQPSSVEERRRRLLHQLGLIGDTFLSHREPMEQDDGDSDVEKRGGGCEGAPSFQVTLHVDMGRSASCDGLLLRQDERQNSSPCAIVRSRSDGAVDSNCGGNHGSPTLHKPHPSPSKPPIAKPLSSGTKNNGGQDVDADREDSFEDGEQQSIRGDLYCTIKNLDSGEEFVVKELREDGMWNKLREVGTGRQLTMEEFQSSVVGHSPIVQELMRRQNVEDAVTGKADGVHPRASDLDISGLRSKKKGSWLRSIKNVAGTVVHRMEKRSSDERDTSSEKGGRRSSSATDDSQDAQSHHGPERVKVRHYGKTWKELTGLFMSQEVRAHNGSIWSMKFSLDGRFLASAGEDCIIQIWQVMEMERKGDLLTERAAAAPSADDGGPNSFAAFGHESPETMSLPSNIETISCYMDKKRRAKATSVRKSLSFDQIVLPENIFTLSEKPICSFHGHLEDVLDLSWSKSEHLLSSSMDKTVRLWHMSSNSCLKIFSHSDYVTCIQFNPVNDDYFISGSLDAKVRLWSISGRQVVDWKDVHEMVTAACYTPDGKGALVGSHKGGCHVYDASENKLRLRSRIDLQNKKKRSHHKKITGFQFVPGSSSEVIVTSADSRIRLVDGLQLVLKFKGFLNTSSQISASLTPDGKYVVCASEDSHVYVWRYDPGPRPSKGKAAAATTRSYELFHCRDVSAAIAWPGAGRFSGGAAATWPEEKLLAATGKQSPPRRSAAAPAETPPAWGMVIVTACRGGEIRIFQNFGCPLRI
ncbi:unnamed protein product [Spirodela intermedia]|uniref:Uncharacterized protein n=1 Tax=Spirodela intermedia TaxID=51605 RepID=A0A7I8KNM7_SPIIN|nr:unnamed protein product [Spirodela intermedia]